MFKSIELYRNEYKLIDSDFEEVFEAEPRGKWGVKVGIVVIEIYEKRNLPVAKNLMFAIRWYHKNYKTPSLSDNIENNRKYNPKFAKYEKDLEKYMLLL